MLDLLGELPGLLEALGDSAEAATEQLSPFNLPSGFKAAAFAAAAAVPGGPTLPPIVVRRDPWHPRIPGGTDGAQLPVSQSSVRVEAGAIVVHAAPGQNAEQIAEAVLSKCREIAMAQSDDTLQFPFN